MIDKNWFELDKCKIFDELISEDYEYICLELDNRWFEITSEYYENNVHLSINLWENHSNLCVIKYETAFIENSYVEEIKTLFKRWLLEKYDILKLEIEFSKLIVYDIYEYYLKGNEGLVEYEWKIMEQAIKERSINLKAEYLITFYDLCKSSPVLRKFTPSASLGMFSLSVKDVKYFYEKHFCYLFCDNGKNIVANYDHTEKCFFDTPEQAIKFLEEKAVVFLDI